ncbi:diguanylate cyclase (GGDEF)-like protein [Stackebrandtia endophytica]|uniref:Diguanylate cyclase (GGDEF)-like protein n=1 Tax=Stackebrandtia endophytica TaxID=1496996 RepID=A0A543AQ95_9ACTN|nr:GGDEF domain-containing protein [Stackebrandtia endophytica]TQL74771.1 diguanylate cyclase (GGDEF)-like protein [Stackebrandtia endophytica]
MPSSQHDTSFSTWQDDFVRLRAVMLEEPPHRVIDVAERIAEASTDPMRVAQARQFVLAANINLRDRPGIRAALARASDAVENCPDLRLVGNFNALAAWSAYQSGSLKNCGTHLIKAERALSTMTERGEPAANAWRNLSLTYSIMGYHQEAEAAFTQMMAVSNVSLWDLGRMQAVVRCAIALDHRGDADGCATALRDLLVDIPDESELDPPSREWLNFAARRLTALGHPSGIRLSGSVDLPVFREVRLLAQACDLISAGDGEDALKVLDHPDVQGNVAGAAEPLRIRSLALSSLGRYAEALAAERQVIANISDQSDRLRPLLLDSVGALLDHEHLRKTAARYADAAMTDPLTGLPNRRRLERFVRDLVARGSDAMVGMLDLDGFKTINDTYGHATGDQVLQRVAGILARSIRIGDLLARSGGDEFVVVLPEATVADADGIGARINEAVTGDDWQRMVIDIPVSISIGWAPLKPGFVGVADALHDADQAMYRVKRSRRKRLNRA